MEQDEIRQYIRDLKAFYTNLVVYGAVNIGCMIIWVCMGFGPFWPIWVMLGTGIAALLQAIRLGKLPSLGEYLPFLNSDWEEKQINNILHGNKTKQEVIKTESVVEEHSKVMKPTVAVKPAAPKKAKPTPKTN